MTTSTLTRTPEARLVMQDLVRVHVPHERTDGAYFVMEVEVAPGGGPPPLHTHPASEFFWTLQGTLSYFRMEDDGSVSEFTGGPGTHAYIPSEVPHTYRNFSAHPARYLAVLSPPEEMQEFLLAAGARPGEPLRDFDEVLAIGARFGLQLLDIVPEPRG
jgi:mannose-6-phosphate isomerase-like protein (cupin superfamily)